jgi:SAM-dependent methyltransferase
VSDWTGGYVADIEYLPGFYRELAPAHLDAICLVNGIQPPDRADGFEYCELGCGSGSAVSLLAAAVPEGRFVGIDFNPAHIARGKALARAAGLSNLTLHECSFEQALEPGGPHLPQFDYITMHGVYAWIGRDSQRAILRFLDRFLKPGGVAYVSYNALPGWTQAQPLQRLLREIAMLSPERSDRQIADALAFAQAVHEAKSPALAAPDLVGNLQKELDRGQVAYLAHEYLNGHWQPLYHVDVARDFAEAKLAYVGSGTVFENYPPLCFEAPQKALLDQIKVAPLRETLKDYFLQRSFRRDVFVRGARRLTEKQRDALLSDVTMVLSTSPDFVRMSVKVPAGEAALEPRTYDPVFAALKEGPQGIGDLLARANKEAPTTATPAELLGMLLGSGQAHPLVADAPQAKPALGFHRAVLAACAAEGRPTSALPASKVGTGLHMTLIELLAIEGLLNGAPEDGEALARAGWRSLAARGDKLRKDGVEVEGEAAHMDALQTEMAAVLAHSLPIWKRLGVL